MKILELRSENFKKIKAIDITPKEDVVIISGKNAQGKSSVLDSIWAALTSKAIPEKPIREGEKKAEIELNLGKLIIRRTFTEKGDYLTVTNVDGARFPSPQKMLDEFVGDLSFDPLEFMKLKEKEQKDLLLKIVNFVMSTGDLEAVGLRTAIPDKPLEFLNNLRLEFYQQRTIINRDLLNVEEQLKATPKLEPTEKVSVKELFEKKQDLQRIKEDITTKEAENKTRELEIKQLDEQINKEETELKNYIQRKEKEIEEYIAAQKKALEEYNNAKRFELQNLENRKIVVTDNLKITQEKIKQEISRNPELDRDIEGIDKHLQEADETNEKATLYEKRVKLENDHDRIKQESDDLSRKLAKLDEIKTKIVSSATMPIQGLSFDGETIAYQGIPLSQTSLSEQLKVSLAIAMALNPKLRVIRISDGSLLDTENMEILKELAKEKDYQIWCEVVDETGKVGFYIEEGVIKDEPK